MPIYQLPEEIIFPPVDHAEPGGILAIGGDLSPERVLTAYGHGIFPWFSEGEPIVWWSPDPRMVLFPEELKISKSMRQVLRSGRFTVTFDRDFPAVIRACAETKRQGQGSTWITQEMQDTYIELHEYGYAHSVEVWEKGELVGGLYGENLGNLFFGESMFTRTSNASKTGFITLVKVLEKLGCPLIDCQVYTEHLASMGAELIYRGEFIRQLQVSLEQKTWKGNWGEMEPFQTGLEEIIRSNYTG